MVTFVFLLSKKLLHFQAAVMLALREIENVCMELEKIKQKKVDCTGLLSFEAQLDSFNFLN
jgi:hypothetical protein